jgi:MoxR-like ATPase
MDVETAATHAREVLDEVTSAVITRDELVETVVTAVLAEGHVLLEDVPGTGKTLTARSLATALGLEFTRVQFTPDLLPSDVTGTQVFDEREGTFEFQEGPVFANVVLADEINRAPPKTQAAMLEAMAEGQVSVGGETHDLPDPFVVVATQNPVEQEGTFELPEAQRDRFMMKTEMGYPDRDGELELLARRKRRQSSDPEAGTVADPETVRALRDVPETVRTADALDEYVVDICRATREDDRVDVGVSPRGVQRLFEASRARAVVAGDVHAVLTQVLAHRVVLTTEASVRDTAKAGVVADAASRMPVPSMDEIDPD